MIEKLRKWSLEKSRILFGTRIRMHAEMINMASPGSGGEATIALAEMHAAGLLLLRSMGLRSRTLRKKVQEAAWSFAPGATLSRSILKIRGKVIPTVLVNVPSGGVTILRTDLQGEWLGWFDQV